MNVSSVQKQAKDRISKELAEAAGMSLEQLRLFVQDRYRPAQRQIQLLARELGMFK